MNTVSHAPTTPSEKQLKQSAKAIQSALKELFDIEINYTQALEISARSHKFKSWDVACATAKKVQKQALNPLLQPLSKKPLGSMSTLDRLHQMEDHFESLGYPQLKMACKAIVGCHNNKTDLLNSVWEMSMKANEGVWFSTWLPHKIAILQNEDLFKKVAGDFGFDATQFIDGLTKKIAQIEDFLLSSEQPKEDDSGINTFNRITAIFNVVQLFEPSSKGMQTYINSLGKEDYALLAATFDLGRQGWERSYEESREYESFVENMAADGRKVTRDLADKRFLPKDEKQRQFDWLYQYMLNGVNQGIAVNEYSWLSQKTNIITETRKGVGMLQELM
ncbi:glyoxalase superfamily protein [Sulfuricurvum sp.]|uniref:glyoxalase superfamily protein n=1 Tax=Sulfuricurvum sp. TaxID=2025608 RepID=UPI002E344F4F|nr:glyoxalase superfamily protein [Sulfuricurvum sp.]HEX5330620.1 glyoxalase superfamily protein [Sulfuricurvum sp.]